MYLNFNKNFYLFNNIMRKNNKCEFNNNNEKKLDNKYNKSSIIQI